MSTCPDYDMHSVYLDGELPQKYALDYETHLTSCQRCRDDFIKIQRLSTILKEEARESELSSQELEVSFARLQTKLHYQKTIKDTQPQNIKKFTWVVPAVVAAALAFALILPMGTHSPISAATKEQPISIAASALTGGLSVAPSVNYNTARFLQDSVIAEENFSNIQTVSLSRNETISPMDFFRPSFDKSEDISIKMTLSNLSSIPVQGSTTVPIQMYITISGE